MARLIPVRRSQTIKHGWHLLRNRKTLWQMMREVMSGSYRMSGLTTIIAVLALAYVVFPFDLIPDFIPVVGWIDDGIVVYLLFRRLVYETQRYNRFKARERRSGDAPAGL